VELEFRQGDATGEGLAFFRLLHTTDSTRDGTAKKELEVRRGAKTRPEQAIQF